MAPRTGKPPRRAAPGLARRRRRNPPDALIGLVLGLRRPDCLQLCLEEVLVDLPVVDRHALFDAHPDHLLPVETELLRQFFGREVIRHRLCSFRLERKNPPRATRWRARSHPRLSWFRASCGPPRREIHHPKNMPRW